MAMAQPLLSFLTGRARAALPFIESGVARGLSPTKIIESLIGLTPLFRRQTMLDVIAALQGRADLPRWMRITPPSEPLPLAAHVVSPVDLRGNYQYVLKVDNAPFNVPPNITVNSAVSLSQEEIFDNGRRVLVQSEKYPINEAEAMLIQFEITKATIAPSAPTVGIAGAAGLP
jgi:hypothetical protein